VRGGAADGHDRRGATACAPLLRDVRHREARDARGHGHPFEGTNPPAYLEPDVPDEKGAVKHWSVELGSTSILQQGGWKFSDIKAGDKVTAVINPLRSGDAGGLLSQVTLRDGRVLGNGPGRGAQ